MLIFCCCVTAAMVFVFRSEPLRREREAAGPAVLWLIGLLCVSTISIGGLAVLRLVRMWRATSSGVFTSEV
jgi:hypothetical protein